LTILRSIFPFSRVALGAGLITVGFAASSVLGSQALAPRAMAQTSSLQMLDRFEVGQWEVRTRDLAAQRSLLCIDNGRDLIQLRHGGENCRSFVVEDGPGSVTVQYTCPGNGYGRTRIRFENARLAQVDSQGIAGGLPFDFSAEARKIGGCATAHR
jgi:hypothetical protein